MTRANEGAGREPAAPAGRKRWLALLLLASPLALGAAPQASQQTPPAPTFPSGVEVVTVDAVVLDKRGTPIVGLTQDDFKVSEEGRPQAITSFEAVVLPESEAAPPPTRSRVSTNVEAAPRPERSFVLIFDNAHMGPISANKAREALAGFLHGLREGDQITVVPTAGGAWWSARMPEGYEDLRLFLDRLKGQRLPDNSPSRLSEYEAMQIYFDRDPNIQAQVARRFYENGVIADLSANNTDLNVNPGQLLIRARATEVYQNSLNRNQATLKVLERAVASLTATKGRKSVIMVSEGFVRDPTVREFEAVTRAARQADAAIYFVDARGLFGPPDFSSAEASREMDENDILSNLVNTTQDTQGSQSLALDTGGYVIRNTNDLERGLRGISDRSRAYYLIGYIPTNTHRDGKFRSIDVTVTSRPDAKVEARRGYYAPSDAPVKPAPSDSLEPPVRQALDSPYGRDSIPLRMTSYVFGDRAGKAAVLLVTDADPKAIGFTKQADRFNGVLESFAVIAGRDSGENFSQERKMELSLPSAVHDQVAKSWLPILRDFELPPGVYQARMLIRDPASGRIGTVRHEFDVPDPGKLRTSTPILTDTLQPGAGGAPARPVPLARRTFEPEARVVCYFEVYGAGRDGQSGAPKVSAGGSVRRVIDGTALVNLDSTPMAPAPDGSLSRRLDLPLHGVPPGEYEFVLSIKDDVSRQTLEVEEPFTIGKVGN